MLAGGMMNHKIDDDANAAAMSFVNKTTKYFKNDCTKQLSGFRRSF